MADGVEIGLYVRIKRDDKWQNLDIAELSDEELEQYLKDRLKIIEDRISDDLVLDEIKWLGAAFTGVVAWVRDHVKKPN